jgi:hypothetical protein
MSGHEREEEKEGMEREAGRKEGRRKGGMAVVMRTILFN